MSNEQKPEEVPEEVEPLTLEELITAASSTVTRKLEIELSNGEKMVRQVRFKPLTFGQSIALDEVPTDDLRRYTKTVVKLCSVEPLIKDMDELNNFPSSFVRHYSNLILDVSGKTPFLG